MVSVSVRDLRNDTGGVLRRVENGETLTVLSNKRPVAQLVPLRQEKPMWMPADRFFAEVAAHPADPGLRDELKELMPDTIESLWERWDREP